jgi:hypothetical protein
MRFAPEVIRRLSESQLVMVAGGRDEWPTGSCTYTTITPVDEDQEKMFTRFTVTLSL